jgi:hypothetical protein
MGRVKPAGIATMALTAAHRAATPTPTYGPAGGLGPAAGHLSASSTPDGQTDECRDALSAHVVIG